MFAYAIRKAGAAAVRAASAFGIAAAAGAAATDHALLNPPPLPFAAAAQAASAAGFTQRITTADAYGLGINPAAEAAPAAGPVGALRQAAATVDAATTALVVNTEPWWNGRTPSLWTSEDAPRCAARLAGRLALLRIDGYGPAAMMRCARGMWDVTGSRTVPPAVRAELGIPARAFARIHVAGTSVIVWTAGPHAAVHVIRS